eukprot:6856108-Pyramimonas_sp.AAC.1
MKSRMCGRGYLDTQKFEVDRRSSTAARSSQRIQLSVAQTKGLDVESIDISADYLQGLTFKELLDRCRELGTDVRSTRKVHLRPPANVWRHLCKQWGWTFDESYSEYLNSSGVRNSPGAAP